MNKVSWLHESLFETEFHGISGAVRVVMIIYFTNAFPPDSSVT